MKKKRHIQKVNAALLLVLILFISVLKTSHGHEAGKRSADHHQHHAVFYTEEANQGKCAICEFQLLEEATFIVSQDTYRCDFLEDRQLSYYNLALPVSNQRFEGRGPPAC